IDRLFTAAADLGPLTALVNNAGVTSPIGRAGEPDEVAGAVAWLLGPDATYTTGAVLRVAGGL
ncbi:SDR family oxidoreductase, partial [Streptomyces sp. NPDC052644]